MESKNLDFPTLFLLETMGQLRSSFHQAKGVTLSVRRSITLGLLNALWGKDKRKARKHSMHVRASHDGNLNTRR